MKIGPLQAFGSTRAVSALFASWNALPRLYADGPAFLIVSATSDAHVPAIQLLLRALAVEHSARKANSYWSCASIGADGATNGALLDLLDRHGITPDLPYLWLSFGQDDDGDPGASLRRAMAVTSECHRRSWGDETLEKRERAGNIARRLGETFGQSAVDFGLDSATRHGLLSERTYQGFERITGIQDAFEGAIDFLDEICGADGGDPPPVESYDRLARQCLKILGSLGFAASSKQCGTAGAAPLTWPDGKARIPLIVTVQAIEKQGAECLTFLRSLIATCEQKPWPVLIIASTERHNRARQIIEGDLHRTAATQHDLARRIFEIPIAADCGFNSAEIDASDMLARFQSFVAEFGAYLNDIDTIGTPTASTAFIRRAIDLRNEIARLSTASPLPGSLEMSFALIGICLAIEDVSNEPVCARLVFLEALSSEISAYIAELLARDFPPAAAKGILDTETSRLESLYAFYRDCFDMTDLRPLFASDGPVCAALKVAEKYDLPRERLWDLTEGYLYSVSRLRPAASKSGELRFEKLRRHVSKGVPSLEEALETRHLLRLGQAQYYLGRLEDAVDSFKLVVSRYRLASPNAPAGDERGGPRHALAIKLLKKAEQRMRDDERHLAGGGIVTESLKLIKDLWGR